MSHRDENGFYNPLWMTGENQPGGQMRPLRLLRWRLGGTRVRWPERIIDPAPPGDPWTEPPAGTISVTFIGHSCFLIRLPGLVVITDPQFSERASPVGWAGPKRARPPGRPLAALPPIDLVLLSHNHYDHLDLPSLRALHRHSAPKVITPLGNTVYVRRAAPLAVHELDWWDTAPIARPAGARVTALPARHFSARSLRDNGRALWAGFMLESQGIKVLFAGDSGDGAHWQAIRECMGAPDLALLPIGAYAPRDLMQRVHMDPEEAVRAHCTLQATRSIGMHFGTFQLTDEAIDEPERRLAQACRNQGVPATEFVTLGFGACCSIIAAPQETVRHAEG